MGQGTPKHHSKKPRHQGFRRNTNDNLISIIFNRENGAFRLLNHGIGRMQSVLPWNGSLHIKLTIQTLE